MKTIITILSVFIIVPSLHAQERVPIIDMNLHSYSLEWFGYCFAFSNPLHPALVCRASLPRFLLYNFN